NDGTPAVSVAATDASGAEPNDPIVFTFTRTVNLFTQITVNLTWSGTATFGSDYTLAASGGTLSANGQQLTLAVGATTATITLNPVDDLIFEGSETATVTIGTGTGYTVGTPASATGTIADNDVAPSISVTATDASGSEQGPDPIVFSVVRSANTNGAITV